MKINETNLGFEITVENFFLFFGKKESSLANLTQTYPQFTFKRLKQIHSDAVCKTTTASPDYETLGDAHFSKDLNLALCSITADCIPVLIFDSKNKICSAIHAGWRGVASRIIIKTIQELLKTGCQAEDLKIYIGPHIRQNSFEIGTDVKDMILASLPALTGNEKLKYFKPQSADKVLLDLNLVAREQVSSQGIPSENIWDIQKDTVSSDDFHSYRRDKNESGRQISFIARVL
ncbi:hypothetical protein BDW_13880 [Bdellovibrio bacteriovorus W]|nr:hypothetical protein BDW_13880 [Bdellovibrio bacteriovorus W]